MTNSDLTQLLVIVDRSGSMSTCEEDMRGGLNQLFKEQAEVEGECVVDYVQFDTEYELVYTDKPVAEAEAVLVPRGGTALLDAIGKSVTQLGEKLAGREENDRPANVLVVIVTDGYENSSREWTKDRVKELIERQTNEWNWNFLFLGANMDAVAEAAAFGISHNNSLTYDGSNSSVAMASVSAYTTQYRGTGQVQSFTDEDRKNAVKS